jgi:hypothetical protein
MSDFNDLMEAQRKNRIEWYTLVGVENDLFKDQDTSDPNAALFVDVGVNRGQNVEALSKLFPKAQGKIVLQDLPPVSQMSRSWISISSEWDTTSSVRNLS